MSWETGRVLYLDQVITRGKLHVFHVCEKDRLLGSESSCLSLNRPPNAPAVVKTRRDTRRELRVPTRPFPGQLSGAPTC